MKPYIRSFVLLLKDKMVRALWFQLKSICFVLKLESAFLALVERTSHASHQNCMDIAGANASWTSFLPRATKCWRLVLKVSHPLPASRVILMQIKSAELSMFSRFCFSFLATTQGSVWPECQSRVKFSFLSLTLFLDIWSSLLLLESDCISYEEQRATLALEFKFVHQLLSLSRKLRRTILELINVRVYLPSINLVHKYIKSSSKRIGSEFPCASN